MPRPKTCAAVLALLLATSCSTPVSLRVTRDSQGQVSFQLVEVRTGAPIVDVDVFDLVVRDEQAGDEGRVIWQLSGRARLGAVRYGIPPAGMSEKRAAEALIVGRRYALFASGSRGMAAASASTTFVLAPDGGVEQEPWRPADGRDASGP